MVDRRYDIAFALAFIALGVFIIVVARTIPMGLIKDAVGPRAFFFGIGILSIVGGGILTMQRLRYWKAQKDHMIPSEGTKDEKRYPASFLRAAGVIGMLAAYIALMNPLGYLLSTPLFITGGLVILGERKWWNIILIAVSFTVVFYFVFAQLLDVRISVGPFKYIFRDLGWI